VITNLLMETLSKVAEDSN